MYSISILINIISIFSGFFSAELELQQERASQKWGFDFRADRPLASNASYNWQRVSSQESTFAPQMYTLTRAAHVRPAVGPASDMEALLNDRADRENSANSSLDASTDTEYDSQDESLSFKCSSSSSSISVVASTSAAALIASAASSATATTCSSPAQQRKRQLKITGEFRFLLRPVYATTLAIFPYLPNVLLDCT